MQNGSVIIYRERGRLALGVIQKITATTGKSQHIEILDEEGRKQLLTSDRIALDGRRSLTLPVSPVEAKRALHTLREQISIHGQKISLPELWELLNEESGKEFTAAELAEFLLGPADDALAMAAVLDALWGQTVYFKEKRVGFFTPRDAKSVEDSLHQQRMEAQRIRTQEEFLSWVRERLLDPATATPPPGADRGLDLLKNLALHGELSEKRPQALKLLDEIEFRGKGHPWDVAFQLLVALGIWQEDEELSLLRYRIPTRFPGEVLQAAADVSAFDAAQSGYLDLTALLTFSIDDSDTTEIDDALSLSEENGALVVGVHIADAGYFVLPGGIIDHAALTRGTTVYLPRGKLPMLPPVLSEDKASLRAETIRPTLSFFATLDEAGHLHAERLCRGFIRVGRRLSYTEADAWLQSETPDPYVLALRRLSAFAQTRRALRIAQGAVVIDSEEVKVKVSEGKVSVAVSATDSAARNLVSECMILANEMAARYCFAHHLPALYVAQPPPDETVAPVTAFPTQRVHAHATRRLMKPSQIGVTPAPHTALGLAVYTQATSPLRRYHDLQMQHQIKHHLEHGTPLFDAERLQVVAAGAQESTGEAKRCERESTRYWLLRFLETQKGRTVNAQVVREQNSRCFIELDDTLLTVPLSASPPLPLGTAVQVVIGHVDARRDMLSVRLA